jgi:site-specific recombinase XerD
METSVVNVSGTERADREKVEGWPYYVRRTNKGRPVFFIERQMTIDGQRHRFHVSTRATSLKAALEQLARFEADPFKYNPVGGDLRAPLLLTAELAERFFKAQLARGLSRKYARETFTWLKRWGKGLRGVDLRRLSVARDVLPVLDAAGGAKRPMMAALKTFVTWLRVERHELTSAEDVTRDLRLPQADVARHKRQVAHDVKHVRKALAKLKGVYRDALLFQAATACHISELERFVRDERSRLDVFDKPKRLADGSQALAVVSVWHKTKKQHRLALVRRETVEAAQRLMERGTLPPRNKLNEAVYAACDAAKVPRFSFALRHSVLTWGAQRGVSEERLAQHAGHEDVRTTRRYVDVDLPLAAIPAEKL